MERHAETPHFFALCSANTPTLGVQKHFFWPMVCRCMGVWGATPKTKQFSSIVHYKHPHPRYSKTPFLAHGVQRYGRLGCHPRTQTLFFGMFKHHHPRYPKTPFLAYGVPWYGCLERHPRTPPEPHPKQFFLALCSSITTIPGIQKYLCWPMGYSGMGVWSATPEPKQ